MARAGPSRTAPRFWTAAGLTLCLLIVFSSVVVELIVSQHVWGVYGWNIGPDGKTLISVTPGYPAADAGIQVGDRVDFASLPLVGRVNLFLPEAVAADEPLTLTVSRGGHPKTLTLHAAPEGGLTPAAFAVLISGVLVTGLGIWLVLLRPSRMTWGFLPVGVATAMSDLAFPFSTPTVFFVSSMALLVGNALSFTGLLIFVSRFPGDDPRGWLRILDRAAIPIGCAYLILTAYWGANMLLGTTPPPYVVGMIADYLFPAFVAICALAALATSVLTTEGSARQRLVPVISTFALWTALYALSIILNTLYTNFFVTTMLPMLLATALSLFAVAVAYGVVRHRVIDVSFVVSRTLVYTILTAILVGIFALIDLFIGKWLEHSQIAFALEIVAAVFIGLSLNAMHGRVDRFVDSVLFRRRHLAERHLERTAYTLPHATTADFVDEALVVEPAQSLDLASSALFRKNSDGRFERRAAQGWSDGSAQLLDASDHLVIQLEAELDSLNLSGIRWPRADIPSGLCQPLLAVPVVVRHRLMAFALYGGHVGGEALDPDEVRSLRLLAVPAGAAYDHLEAEALREQIDRLRTANAQLQLDKELNVSALELMRRQMTAIDELLRQRHLSTE